MTPEHVFPGSGALFGAKLGIPGVPALDIRQQCAAMPFSFQLADGLIGAGAARTVLVVGAEAHAGFMPWDDWDVLTGETDREITTRTRTSRPRAPGTATWPCSSAMARRRWWCGVPPKAPVIWAPRCTPMAACSTASTSPAAAFKTRPYFTPEMFEREEHMPRMMGEDLMKTAVTELNRVVRSLTEKHGISLDQVDWFVAHQANDRINAAVQQALGIPAEKVPSNIARFGNTSAATIGILLDEMLRDGRAKPGQLICFFALGSGLNWGATLIRL